MYSHTLLQTHKHTNTHADTQTHTDTKTYILTHIYTSVKKLLHKIWSMAVQKSTQTRVVGIITMSYVHGTSLHLFFSLWCNVTYACVHQYYWLARLSFMFAHCMPLSPASYQMMRRKWVKKGTGVLVIITCTYTGHIIIIIYIRSHSTAATSGRACAQRKIN